MVQAFKTNESRIIIDLIGNYLSLFDVGIIILYFILSVFIYINVKITQNKEKIILILTIFDCYLIIILSIPIKIRE